MKTLYWALIAGLAILMAFCSAHSYAAPTFTGQVVGVHDGDTLTVVSEGAEFKIRLAEIDAPEKKQAFGERAKQSLSDLCYRVRATVSPQTIDRYGRTVARVRCGGADASLHQVETGMAWAYLKYSTDPAIAAAEALARADGRGLWTDANPTPPWLWRKKSRAM